MSTASLSLQSEVRGRMRPINILRDLPKIADLVELCFHKNMDSEGQRYVQQMRSANQNSRFLQWANSSLPMLGYVWEDGSEIIGNISIVPFSKRIFLLANIAVHPDYRRRGIARQLTERGMQHVRERRAQAIWLQVEDQNDPAIHLYESLGFESRAKRSTWNASIGLKALAPASDPRITRNIGRFWPYQQAWLMQAYPPHLHWYRMPNFEIFGPGIKNWLYRLFVESDLRQWALQQNGMPKAIVSWLPMYTRRTQLWLATAPDVDAQSLSALLLHARLSLRARNADLYIDYPAEQHAEAFQQAGFSLQRTLLWMEAPGSSQPWI